MSNHNDNKLVFDTFDQAVAANFGAKPLFHSDRGFQYTSSIFKLRLKDHGMTQSMSLVGYCIDNGPAEGFWGIVIKKARDKAVMKGKKEFSYYYHHKFDNEYDALIMLADDECPPPLETGVKKKGRKKKGKERSLIEWLKALKASVRLFIKDFSVPFDNNQAERDVRNVKTKTKYLAASVQKREFRIILMLCLTSALAENMEPALMKP